MSKPIDIILFGGAGDLSLRKLLPALYRMHYQGSLEKGSRIIVCCHLPKDIDNMPLKIKSSLQKFLQIDELTEKQWDKFLSCLTIVALDLVNAKGGWSTFSDLFEGKDNKQRLYYLAVMPSIYSACCKNLSANNLITNNSRIVVEKPLGYDYETAENINQTLADFFAEGQIYRIDHYLGKQSVQNILALRFHNPLFESFWSNQFIEQVEIRINEEVGLEGRNSFYDGAGAIRDMVQNHLLQLLCLTAMEPPTNMKAETVRSEKIKLLQALKPIVDSEIDNYVVRGQYAASQDVNKKVTSYLQDLGEDSSDTDTYVAIKAFVENKRWQGVPFYLRTGKRLKKRSAEIVIKLKADSDPDIETSNLLVIAIQPENKLTVSLQIKDINENKFSLQPALWTLDCNKQESENNMSLSSAYQRLLLNAIEGDSTLFIHRDEVKAAWKWIDPIIEHWQTSNNKPCLYDAGSWGPSEANKLFNSVSSSWTEFE